MNNSLDVHIKFIPLVNIKRDKEENMNIEIFRRVEQKIFIK